MFMSVNRKVANCVMLQLQLAIRRPLKRIIVYHLVVVATL